ncbi:ATP-binding protein [Desertibacillus haloalkaliphilus]|uniref:ATP-binding protein n=1 Tax=Desertibacillus haloalkaliphilus TaxID=1328930 RepID=UPI001C262BE4|nr:ATP-binding protein [Desertibacillus haloalkaliphilus]MBU8906867.1 STAS domain-containing protein [Desertibacillus haloalkaliphilus]
MRLNGNHAHQQVDENEKVRLSRLASIGEVSAGIAHEVRNPLTSVKGFLQLIQQEEANTYVDIALNELDHAIDTLNDLLQVSKPEQNEEAFININLYSELESILSLFQDQVYRVEIIKEYKDKDTIIYGQKNALKKAFFNLFKNAFEAIPEEGSITLDYYRENSELIIIVEDTGVGIPEDKLEMLGTPFFSTKDEGTGMGVTQIFSTLYKHGAKVNVTSKVNVGTTFTIIFPIIEKKEMRLVALDKLTYIDGHSFSEFITYNKEHFERILKEKIKSILPEVKGSPFDEDHLFESTHKIIDYIQEDSEHELIYLAKEHGISWAKSDLTSTLKLEWFRGFKEVYWDFLYNFHKYMNIDMDQFFMLEKKTNYYLDSFIHHYFISYNEYNNKVLHSQREVIEELSVPMIPISDAVAILPIVGTMDTFRAKKLQEKSLAEIERLKLKKVIIDLSGVAYLDTAVVQHLFNIVNGYKVMGCDTVLTGIRSEIANTMVELGIPLGDRIETIVDLKSALEEYNVTM